MPQDERGFHLEIATMGNKEIHYHDTDLDRFHRKSQEIISEFLKDHGVTRDGKGELLAANINIMRYTV